MNGQETGAPPVASAAIILVRDAAHGPEVFLLRRHAGSGFMADHFVFPGGRIDPGDGGPRRAALRELFEEAGVLIGAPPLPAAVGEWRRRLNAGEVGFDACVQALDWIPAEHELHLWGRWITPAFQPHRFDTWFYVARLPAGQVPSFDARETVEELWTTPARALAQSREGALALPPPQLATLERLAADAPADVDALLEALQGGAHRDAPVLPRLARGVKPRTLLFPWDPQYEQSGQGEGLPLPPGHVLAGGSSRAVFDAGRWRLA